MGCIGGWNRALPRGKESRCIVDVQIGWYWGPGCGDRPLGVSIRDFQSADLPVKPPRSGQQALDHLLRLITSYNV